MPLVRDIKNRDSKKTLIINLGDDAKRSTGEQKKKRKKKSSSEEYMFFVKQDPQPVFSPGKDFMRMLIAGFFIVFVFNIAQIGNQLLSIASDVEANAFQGFDHFVEGGKDALEANFGGAVQYFDSAGYAFEEAQEKVWFIGNHGIIGTEGSMAKSAYTMLEAGEHISSAASFFSQGASAMQEIPVLFAERTMQPEGNLSVSSVSLTDKLKSSLTLYNHALDEVKIAQDKIRRAGSDFLPENIQSHVAVLTDQLNGLVKTLEEMQTRVPAILSLLGDRYPHRYLILLQNNAESRPTGGFIGSFLIVDMNDGAITNMKFHDVYEYDGQLHETIEAPYELATFTDNWRMRDANYSPDFAVSAKKIAWFLEKEGGPGVDTVIAVNQTILGDLLTVTGPLSVDGLEGSLNDKNYQTVLSYIVESKHEGEHNPKAIIGRIIPSLQEALHKEASVKSVLTLIQQQIKNKDILAWSKDETVQTFFDDVGVSGRVPKLPSDEDYFSLIATNIGGNKSDRYIDADIAHETIINDHGEVRNVVTYKRTHTWNPNIVLVWQSQLESFGFTEIPDWIRNILGAGTNKSIIKVFVPSGATLEEIIGVPREAVTIGYDSELDKTYMYFVLDVAPQEEKVVTMTYKLPYTLDLSIADEYRITVQKQPGIYNNVSFVKRMLADPRITNYRNYPEEVIYTQGKALEYETSLMTDLHFASLWGIQ
ncbi:DUF4012 domain-containing protein [Candidatus Peregrinibacteria bacterium]|nr:DUF4012 domain-containing protein [Candidatus Peregrinibacteria bacterium]